MPRRRNPRHGSMQFWPRKRARRMIARVRFVPHDKDAKPLLFAGYKVGMTHLAVIDNRQFTDTKNTEIFMPATIIECPPMKIYGATFYKKSPYGLRVGTTVLSPKLDKEIALKVPVPKKYEKNIDSIKVEDFYDLRLLVYTQPKLTMIGKKKPELFEVTLGGNLQEKVAWVKANFTKEISIRDVFAEGAQIDTHSITKGKGLQGPVKRFGVQVRFHKSQKTVRGPATLGPWHGQKTYRVAHAGQMGLHQRMELNKWVLKIDNDAKKVNPVGGWMRYGLVKNDYLILKGSIPGASKRLIMFTKSARPSKKTPAKPPQIKYISVESRQ